MTSKAELLELAERCEKASGADREADAMIQDWREPMVVPRWPFSEGSSFCDGTPRYTSSLDAAMTLVPEGRWRWPQMEYMGPNPNNRVQGHRVALWLEGGKPIRAKSDSSFALALTAAALRAQAEMTGDK